jgi:hypothetical protein
LSGGKKFEKYMSEALYILTGGSQVEITETKIPTNVSDDKAEFDLDAEIAKIGQAFDDKSFKTIDKFLADNYQHTCFTPLEELIVMVDKTIDDSIKAITNIFRKIIDILPRVQKDLFARVQTRLEQINVMMGKCNADCLKPLTPEEMKIECDKIKCIPSKYTVDDDGDIVFGSCKTDDAVCNNIKKMCKYTTRGSIEDKEVCTGEEVEGQKTDKASGLAHVGKAVIELNKVKSNSKNLPSEKDIAEVKGYLEKGLIDDGTFNEFTQGNRELEDIRNGMMGGKRR